ncbi:uncharacterized protein METZ01_LOCUS413449, partial [marine metagenome]
MPKLGLTMERGTIGAWLASEGEEVAKGSPLLEVVTDKVTMEVEAQVSGVLRKILIQAGQEVDVATPIGIIGEADEEIGASAPETGASAPEVRASDSAGPALERASTAGVRQAAAPLEPARSALGG